MQKRLKAYYDRIRQSRKNQREAAHGGKEKKADTRRR